MKKFLLVSLFTLSLASFSQTDDKQPLNPDSLVQKTDELKDSISNHISTIKPTDNYVDIDRNMQYIQEIQKKNNAKKKRDAIVRIGIGIGLLVLLVIGLRRKGKTKAD
ncbi:MAG: hypothetical protein IPH34_13465 [Chitinophagaceae bacterium]|nr:hypothetical protein [Chitinophagaceae bacterium]